MKKDLTELKKLVVDIIGQGNDVQLNSDQVAMVSRLYEDVNTGTTFTQARILPPSQEVPITPVHVEAEEDDFSTHIEIEESLSLEDREKELILKALEKHRGKRKYAAAELGISERTLYRKIKEFNLTEL